MDDENVKDAVKALTNVVRKRWEVSMTGITDGILGGTLEEFLDATMAELEHGILSLIEGTEADMSEGL